MRVCCGVEPSIFAIYFWCWLGLLSVSRCSPPHSSYRIASPRPTACGHVRELRYRPSNACAFYVSIFSVSFLSHRLSIFVFCNVQTRQFQFFIFTGVRATRYKFYYCRAVGLITRLQFTAIAFDSPFITLLYMWPFGFFFSLSLSLMHTCRDVSVCSLFGDWMR